MVDHLNREPSSIPFANIIKEVEKSFDPDVKLLDASNRASFRFIGERGIRNRNDAIRLADLDVAKEMTKAGRNPQTIKVATGWEMGIDGKWRYEEPDFKLGDIKEMYPGVKMSQLINDENLFKAYPELKDKRIISLNADDPRVRACRRSCPLKAEEEFLLVVAKSW